MRDSTLVRIAALAGLTALLGAGLDRAIGMQLRRLRTGPFGEFNRIADGRAAAEIAVTGSSRAVLHYDPEVLQRASGLSVFNLGRIGARSEVFGGVLSQYLRHNPEPRIVLQNADLNSFEPNAELYEPAQYAPYLDDPGLYSALSRRHPWIWMMRYLPLYGYVVNDIEFHRFHALRALWNGESTEHYDRGFLRMEREWSSARARTYARREYIYGSDPGAVSDFRAPLEMARVRKIPAIVVLSPVHRDVLSRVRRLEEVTGRLRAVSGQSGAVFWDFSDQPGVSDSRYYFHDPFHLNHRGAAAFSQLLGKRIAEWRERGGGPLPALEVRPR